MSWQDFVGFRKMITPLLIKIIFWIEVAIVIIGGVVMFFVWLIGGIKDSNVGQILLALFGVPIGTILSLLLVRVYAEILIVLFTINDSLTDIRNALLNK